MPHQKRSSHTQLYNYLVRKYGERCFIGGEEGNHNILVIDHWNNNHADDSEQNLHLLCRSMNAVKNPRGKIHYTYRERDSVSERERVRERDSNDVRQITPAQFWKGQESSPIFRHWLFYTLVRLREIPFDDAIESGAAIAHVSTQSIERYIKPVLAKGLDWDGMPVGLYEKRMNSQGIEVIRFKPVWETFRSERPDKKPQAKLKPRELPPDGGDSGNQTEPTHEN